MGKLGLNVDIAAHQPAQSISDRQAKAAPTLLARRYVRHAEWLEEMWHLLGGDPDAGVCYLEDDRRRWRMDNGWCLVARR